MGRGSGDHEALGQVKPRQRRQQRYRYGYWSEERVREILTPLLCGRETFPTRRELDSFGYGLGEAVRRYGGARYWAKQFGLELRSAQDRRPYGVEEAIRDARKLIEDLGYLPGTHRVRELGYPRLATQLLYHRGAAEFQRLYGDQLGQP